MSLVEIIWRMRAPSGRTVECGIYQTDAGFDVRTGFTDLLLTSHVESSLALARQYAEALRQETEARRKLTSPVR